MKKNPKGIFEKLPGSGIWWIRYADATGRIRREKVGNKSAAIKLYQKRKTEVLQGAKLPETMRAKVVTFTELAQDALAYSKTHKRGYQQDVYKMKFLLEAFGGREAESVTPKDLECWLAGQQDENDWAPATANRYKAMLSLVYRLGIENGKIKSNPARLVKRRLENNARLRWLSASEEAKLRSVLQDRYPEHLPELDIALHTGMRRGEQYGLIWDDVDLANRIVTIRLSKNGQMRHVGLNQAALSAFQELFGRSQGVGVVFVNSRGERLLRPRYWFEAAVREAELEDFTWHCLRHTFASRLSMKGVGLRSLQDFMGHRTIQMTTRYAHLSPEHQLAALERLCETSSALDQQLTPELTPA